MPTFDSLGLHYERGEIEPSWTKYTTNIFAFNELKNLVMKSPMTLRDYMPRKPSRKVLSSLNENEIKLTCFQAVEHD